MYIFRMFGIALLGLSFMLSTASTEELVECPNPIFECIGPGSGGTSPSGPPGPIFKPVNPTMDGNVDFNRNFGVIKGGKLTVAKGTPEIIPAFSEYLVRNRSVIDPNGVYLISPKSIYQGIPGSDALLVGGGALTQ